MKSMSYKILAVACGCVVTRGAQLVTTTHNTPMERVVGLLTDLEAKIQADGKLEQESYDKYACWCENTLARKANDIASAKELITELESDMKKLSGEIATHGAEIEQLKKDISANLQSQREANEMRNNQYGEYKEEKTESEQCIGALEAAITVLTGAGTGKKGFLETLQESQLISVASGVRHAVGKAMSAKTLSDKDLAVVNTFMNHPEDFVGERSPSLSAVQIANNPFGDYAPKSTQIQGILKGMYDSFTTSLEKANAEESDAQKSHEELMATKRKELATLQLTLEKQTTDKAEKTKKMADNKQLRDDTAVQLQADEEFFSDTKTSCKAKASDWSERTRLRTEELNGIAQAIRIMTSADAKKIFSNATTTLLQTSAHSAKLAKANRGRVLGNLKRIAQKYKSDRLARLVSQAATSGHFDAVIASIDKMIAFLRHEEQADIQHRDRCQGAQNKNKNDMEDLNHEITKSGNEIERLGTESEALQTKINKIGKDIEATHADLEQLLQLRNDAHKAFVQAVKDDSDAVELLDMAIVALTKFYEKNGKALSLIAKNDPAYTVDQDKAPETNWDGGNYGGRTSETEGIVAIIRMLKEDLEKELKTARAEEAADQAAYVKDRAALNEILNAQKASEVAMEREQADLKQKINGVEEYKNQKLGDSESEQKLESALYQDCSWVDTHFDSRREKRKTEMDGLNEAKDYLAGVE